MLSVLALVLVTGALGACDDTEEAPGPTAGEAADTLAKALASGEFAAVALAGDATTAAVTADYAEVTAGMGELTPMVRAGEVREEGDTATATLAWMWPIAGDEWSYTTDVELTKVGDEWQAAWDRGLVEPSLRPGTVLDLTPIAGERGPITGNKGAALVTDRPVLRFGIDRTKVGAARSVRSARELARLLDIGAGDYAARAQASGPKAFVEALVLREYDVSEAVSQRYHRIKGAVAIADRLPLAPSREFALPILGTVGEVTAEMIEKHPDKYRIGDRAGLSGLQARYDDQLRGTPGAVVEAIASDGDERELFRVDPLPGRPLELTLDERMQNAAEAALAGVGPASALVALRPSDGAILAAANGAGNNNYNIATYGQAAPGSTFKTVSSLALLRAGLTADTLVPCPSRVVVDGKPFENYDDYPAGALGDIALRVAVANSCNTAFISQVGKLSAGDLAAAAASLGLGIDHDLGFPAYFGEVPPPESETEAAADLIGQGGILASPMAMATVMASIQAGKTVVPRLVTSVEVSVSVADMKFSSLVGGLPT